MAEKDDIKLEEELENELDEKCSCEDEKDEKCSCEDEKDNDEKNLEEKDEVVSESIDFEQIAESLGLEDAKSVASLKEKIESVISYNTQVAVKAETTKLKLEATESITRIKEDLETDLLEKANAYATMIVNEWLEENAIEISNQIEMDRNAKIVESVKGLLEENAIDLDEEQSTIVSDMREENEELYAENEDLQETNSKYRALLEDIAKEKEIEKYELSETQKEKVSVIAKDIPVNEDMVGRIKAIAELVQESKPAPKTSAPKKDLTESFSDTFVEPPVITENKKTSTFDSYLNDWINK